MAANYGGKGEESRVTSIVTPSPCASLNVVHTIFSSRHWVPGWVTTKCEGGGGGGGG